jgi:hypothetical protein
MNTEELRNIIREELVPVRAELASIRVELTSIRVHVDGIPLMARKLTVVDQSTRTLRSAFNNFALTNPTSGEIKALHEDVNAVQAENMELATKIATLERLVQELQKR